MLRLFSNPVINTAATDEPSPAADPRDGEAGRPSLGFQSWGAAARQLTLDPRAQIYRRTSQGTRLVRQFVENRPQATNKNHRYQLTAERYRKFQVGDTLLDHDVKREAFDLLTPGEQIEFLRKLPADKQRDTWENTLSSGQRINLVMHDYRLAPALTDDDRNQWAATVIQKHYRGWAARKTLAAQKLTPYPTEDAFYWAHRTPEIMRHKSGQPEEITSLFKLYNTTAPLAYFNQPLLLYSRQRRGAGKDVIQQFGMWDLPWKAYAPKNFGGHTMEKNNIWLQGAMHRELPALLTVSPDDETIVRRSAWRSADTSLHTTTRSLAAYLREILAMSRHARVVNRADGLQSLVPLPSARTVTPEEMKTPSGMPKEELRQKLADIGIDVTGITPQGGLRSALQLGNREMDSDYAKASLYQTLDSLADLIDDIDRLDQDIDQNIIIDVLGASDSDEDRLSITDEQRTQAIEQRFRGVLTSCHAALAAMDTCLKWCAFDEQDVQHKTRTVTTIKKYQSMIATLSFIAEEIYADDTAAEGPLAWTHTLIEATRILTDSILIRA